jgi:hypothetical protein
MINKGQCVECGRDYRPHIEWGDTDLGDGMPCPSDDCPSHNECKVKSEGRYRLHCA